MNYLELLNSNRKVTEADKKFVEKYIAPKIVECLPGRVQNPFTEWTTVTNPLIATLVHFAQELIYNDFDEFYLSYWNVPEGQKVQLFDRAKYLILKLSPEIYSNVID
jgi:hypothetical protein